MTDYLLKCFIPFVVSRLLYDSGLLLLTQWDVCVVCWSGVFDGGYSVGETPSIHSEPGS